ncbi:MAG: polymer-forming cytoskeletal protein [Eubacteriales bacterium]
MKKASKVVKTIIGSKSVLEGNISSEESVSIEGLVKGNIRVIGTLVVAKSASITGDIQAENIVISGIVNGNIAVKNKVEAFDKAQIYGNISAKSLLVDENVIFQGNCNINQELIVKSKGQPKTVAKEQVDPAVTELPKE